MIDKNGKLFGKINIIDLLIILIVIAAVVFFATKMFSPAKESTKADTTKVAITFYADEAPMNVTDMLVEGAPSFEETTNVGFGNVTSFSSEEAYGWMSDAEGNLIKGPLVGYEYLTVSVEVDGSLNDNGVYLGGRLYCVGANYTMHFGKVMVYAKITSITPAE